MREIKFRAWSKRMTMMIPNELMVEAGRQLVIFAKRMKPDLPDQENAKGGLLLPTDDDDLIFMQYTGLNDRNGKEIYEGDVLDGSYVNPMSQETVRRHYKVTFQKGNHYAELIGHHPYGTTMLYFENEKSEVIGNIYENHELLES